MNGFPYLMNIIFLCCETHNYFYITLTLLTSPYYTHYLIQFCKTFSKKKKNEFRYATANLTAHVQVKPHIILTGLSD